MDCPSLSSFFDNLSYYVRTEATAGVPERYTSVHFQKRRADGHQDFIVQTFAQNESERSWALKSVSSIAVQPIPNTSNAFMVHIHPTDSEGQANAKSLGMPSELTMCVFQRLRDRLGWSGVLSDQAARQLLGLTSPMDVGFVHMFIGRKFRVEFFIPDAFVAVRQPRCAMRAVSEGVWGFHTMLAFEPYQPQKLDEVPSHAKSLTSARAQTPPNPPKQDTPKDDTKAADEADEVTPVGAHQVAALQQIVHSVHQQNQQQVARGHT